jgi:5-methyltetrahydropteroyltriglutamate--homocysteine methyltransferase
MWKQVETHLVGTFPRSEKLVAATRAAVRGNLAQSEVDRILDADAQSLILLQQRSGIGIFTDGQLNWQDLFRPFSQIFKGIEVGGLARWFDNNTFYRKPLITDKVRFTGDGLKQYFRVELLPETSLKAAILPGPLTFALLAENKAYQSLENLVDDLAHSMKEVVGALRKMGYEYFQFSEPSICSRNRTKNEFDVAQHAFETCANGNTAIQTYFGDASHVIDRLLEFPVESIGVDLYSTPVEPLADHDFDKILGCGCIDGRNSLLESPSELKDIVLGIRNSVEPAGIHLTPNCDLEFLPHPVAEKKVALLGEIGKLVV